MATPVLRGGRFPALRQDAPPFCLPSGRRRCSGFWPRPEVASGSRAGKAGERRAAVGPTLCSRFGPADLKAYTTRSTATGQTAQALLAAKIPSPDGTPKGPAYTFLLMALGADRMQLDDLISYLVAASRKVRDGETWSVYRRWNRGYG